MIWDERLVIRHYLLYGTSATMAYENNKRYWNPWLEYVVPLALTSATCACLSEWKDRADPSYSLWTRDIREALKSALLAVASVELRYKHDSSDSVGARKLAKDFRERAMEWLRVVEEPSDVNANEPRPPDDQDLILTTYLLCVVAAVSLSCLDSR